MEHDAFAKARDAADFAAPAMAGAGADAAPFHLVWRDRIGAAAGTLPVAGFRFLFERSVRPRCACPRNRLSGRLGTRAGGCQHADLSRRSAAVAAVDPAHLPTLTAYRPRPGDRGRGS